MKEDDNAMMKQPWMWLVLGLPAAVVVAGLVTLFIALPNPEAIVSEPHQKQGFTVQRVQPNGETTQ